jgi:hypothetical protein
VPLSHEDGVAEAERITLTHVVNACEIIRGGHACEPVGVALGAQGRLQLQIAVEVVLQRAFAATGHEEDVVEACGHGLLHDVLDGRLVHNREHLLGRGLRRGKESRAEARRRNHCRCHPHEDTLEE